MSEDVHPSGEQWEIRGGGYAGTVVSVGGGLRGLTYDGREVLLGYGEAEAAHAGIGQHMFPWPNRITDGKYTFEGVDEQLYLTEPARRNAIHGLTRWANWTRTDDGGNESVVEVGHGTSDAPYGYGTHPYLSVGRPIDECVLEFRAVDWLEVSPERMTPIGLSPVAGSPYDFHEARVLGDLDIDNAFTGLGDSWSVTLTDPDSGNRSILSSDTPWLQLYTGGAIGRTALAVEPMTCPPNAFITGQNLVVLKPGDSHTTTFLVSA